MTSTEKQELLSKLGAEEADLFTKWQMKQDERRALEATPVTAYKVWEPGDEEEYYSAATLGRYCYKNIAPDFYAKQMGLAFEDRTDAEKAQQFFTMLQDLHKFAVEHNEGWKPDWNTHIAKYNVVLEGDNLRVGRWNYAQLTILPCLKTDELAQKAIDTFGDRLKILFEYYNS